MDVSALLKRMQARPNYAGQLEHVEILPERPGRHDAPQKPLAEPLRRLLAERGIEQLYSHQVAALEAARAGRDFVVVTGTASGKTLCYNLPILEAALQADARALYLFPTKALAQDQLKGLLELIAASEPSPSGRRSAVAERGQVAAGDSPWRGEGVLSRAIRPGVYDGDTPTAQRRRIRGEANLVLSNPDMLHASVLPYHPKWARFFSDLKFVVIDEIHTYRGILGAHVSAVLRRLMRVCEHYGSRPVFLAASATIANPGELASRLIGREVEVIDDDGSPRGRKYFALWNPSPLGNDSLARRSANDDAVTWLVETIKAGGQSLAFTRTRQAAELIHRYAREKLIEEHSPLAEKIRAYRGGYLPNERRQIEQDLFSGNLRGVAATNALELGIDIGTLDVALLVNYPGTIASCWQQAGRSGRRRDESLAVLLAGNDPVDQYLLRHPDYFFARSPEHAVVDPDNPYVLAKHLPAAAFELPLRPTDDIERFGPLAAPIAGVLRDQNTLIDVKQQYYFAGGQNPAVGLSLRHMSDNTFSIVEKRAASPFSEHNVIANVDAVSAPELVYPEAVYLHNGETYLVRELDLAGKIAYVERRETDYYTQAVLESSVRVTGERSASEAVPHTLLGYGDADVAWQTVAFKKIKFATRENIGLGPVDIPAQNLQTTAVWLAPDDSIRAAMTADGLRASEGVVGLRNLAVVALPLVAMCDSRDLGGVVDSKNFGRTTMILYDRYPGGLGYCERGFAQMPQVLDICLKMVRDCPCADGCPSCVGLPNLRPAIHSDPDLTRGHPMPDKLATVRLLQLLSDATDLISATAVESIHSGN
jgi:DEAD/DEAH box helicase domain-containing protein